MVSLAPLEILTLKLSEALRPNEMLTMTWAFLERLRRSRGLPWGPQIGPWTALDSPLVARVPARFDRPYLAPGRNADASSHALDL